MSGLVNVLLRVLLGLLLLGVVIAAAGPYTGPIEKVIMVPVAALLVWWAWRLQRRPA
jgi:hypothetical protein